MDTASFTVPIDAYGMSLQEVNIIEAARNVRFDICFYGRDTLQPDEIAGVRAWLTDSPLPSRWFFGAWDAPFIAKNGWPGFPVGGPTMGPRDLPPADVPRAQACSSKAAVQEFAPGAPMYGFGSPDQLQRYWSEGFAYTQEDQRFIDLTNQRNVCVVGKGYSVRVQPGDTVAQLDVSGDWSDEQLLAANVAVAQCADDMGYTQQVVDIVAAYQMLTIGKHEAELTAIKQKLDDVVSKATDLLTTQGVM